MAYNEKLADRIRESLMHLPNVEEKMMFGGVCFMLNNKMCVGVAKDEMMCRIDPALDKIVLEKEGCRPMDFTGRPMAGYVFVNEDGMKTKEALAYWIGLCVDFNSKAKAARKKKKRN